MEDLNERLDTREQRRVNISSNLSFIVVDNVGNFANATAPISSVVNSFSSIV